MSLTVIIPKDKKNQSKEYLLLNGNYSKMRMKKAKRYTDGHWKNFNLLWIK